jgi:hypothetical protein
LSPRPRATFAKRQKEQARREKQHAKAQRKLERTHGNQEIIETVTSADIVKEATPASEESPVSQTDY